MAREAFGNRGGLHGHAEAFGNLIETFQDV